MNAHSAPRRTPASRVKRVSLLSLMTLVSLNVWTGSPLLALWIGSRVQGDGPPTMGAMAMVAVVIVTVSVLLILALGALGRTYDELTGQIATGRRDVPWLRSMRGDRPHQSRAQVRVSALDRILIACVVLAIACFEVWFFFFSGSPIGSA